MIFIDAFFSFAAGGRHHLGGDAVIRQLRCGYSAAAPRLFGNCIAVIGHQLGVDAIIRRLRRGYWATALRLFGINLALMWLLGGCAAVIRQLRCGYLATASRLFGPVGPVRLVGLVGLRDGVCALKRESGSLGRVLWWA